MSLSLGLRISSAVRAAHVARVAQWTKPTTDCLREAGYSLRCAEHLFVRVIQRGGVDLLAARPADACLFLRVVRAGVPDAAAVRIVDAVRCQ